MYLTIDIGNTCAKLVVFDGQRVAGHTRIDDWSLAAVAAFASRYPIERTIVSSVVADGRELPAGALRLLPGTTPVPVGIGYATPATLGADRLAAAVGAWMEAGGRDAMVIDIGTCVTYDYVSASGRYLGGNISPGPTLRLKALHAFTSALPLVERRGDTPAIGRDTATAIRSGVALGLDYEVEGYVRRFLASSPEGRVFITGGMELPLSISGMAGVATDRFLVPKGLNHILIYNNEK